MAGLNSKVQEIYSLEQLSGNNTCIHSLSSLSKLITTAVFIVVAVSFGRYDLTGLIPLVFYPSVVTALSETPRAMTFKRILLAMPFCILACLSNIAFDRKAAFYISRIPISFGVISAFTLLLKTYLCVAAVLLLVATTPIGKITQAMRVLKIPMIFCMVFEMTYRYIGTLIEEAYGMYTAYSLRSRLRQGVHISHMGVFIGQLLLRSIDRAERVYAAMKCRGYTLKYLGASHTGLRMNTADCAFMIIVCGLCLCIRLINF